MHLQRQSAQAFTIFGDYVLDQDDREDLRHSADLIVEIANKRRSKERISVMTGTTIRIEQTEQEIFAFEVSDEALEAASATATEKAANYTLAACSGLSVCPA
jgi:hypothetical protein